ncbi:MAG: hypothetical protein IKK14_05910 [Oscillospiraceae bacterium]|nr:hypothetical protein [Oscillospiraceae bacterium]
MSIPVLFATLFAFLPTWFAVFVSVSLTVLMVIAIFRLVAFILEVIPFL